MVRQFCTECKSSVPHFIREDPQDEYFNCFQKNAMKITLI
jgi:hypothetical protein